MGKSLPRRFFVGAGFLAHSRIFCPVHSVNLYVNVNLCLNLNSSITECSSSRSSSSISSSSRQSDQNLTPHLSRIRISVFLPASRIFKLRLAHSSVISCGNAFQRTHDLLISRFENKCKQKGQDLCNPSGCQPNVERFCKLFVSCLCPAPFFGTSL